MAATEIIPHTRCCQSNLTKTEPVSDNSTKDGRAKKSYRVGQTVGRSLSLFGASFSIAGKDSGEVYDRSGTSLPVCSASTNIDIACPVLVGTITVAASVPLRPQAIPVFANPSTPVNESRNHFSRSAIFGTPSNALRAPMAI